MLKTRVPRVSVIVRGDAGRPLRDTLRSVLDQTLSDIEILVAFPRDGRAERLDLGDPRIVPVNSPDTDLPARIRNRCIRRARGLFVAFVDAGDRLEPTRLERQVAAMREQPDLALTYTKSSGPGSECLPASPAGNTHDADAWFGGLLDGNFIPISTVMIRASALRLVGGFDESSRIRGYEDYELWFRMAVREQSIGLVDEPLAWLGSGELSTAAQRHRECLKRRTILRRIERLQPGVIEDRGRRLRSSLASTARHIGRTCLYESRVRRSRRYLRNSIRTSPVQLRSYALLLATFVRPQLTAKILRRFEPTN